VSALHDAGSSKKAVPFLEVEIAATCSGCSRRLRKHSSDWLEHSFGLTNILYEFFAELGRFMAEAALMSDLAAG
jgi:hypothetical protein